MIKERGNQRVRAEQGKLVVQAADASTEATDAAELEAQKLDSTRAENAAAADAFIRNHSRAAGPVGQRMSRDDSRALESAQRSGASKMMKTANGRWRR